MTTRDMLAVAGVILTYLAFAIMVAQRLPRLAGFADRTRLLAGPLQGFSGGCLIATGLLEHQWPLVAIGVLGVVALVLWVFL